MKPLAQAKQRLATVLDDTARMELARKLFTRTLRVLRRVKGITRVLVVSRDAQVLKLARRFGAWSLWESGEGLNDALEQATRVALANGAHAVLIIPADLARLEKNDVEQIIALGSTYSPTLTIAPDARGIGTNALLVKPVGLIRYAFGETSFAEHIRRAQEKNARVEIYQAPTVAFDVDLPEDWTQIENLKSKI